MKRLILKTEQFLKNHKNFRTHNYNLLSFCVSVLNFHMKRNMQLPRNQPKREKIPCAYFKNNDIYRESQTFVKLIK